MFVLLEEQRGQREEDAIARAGVGCKDGNALMPSSVEFPVAT